MATFDEFYASLDPDIGVRGKQFEKFIKWFLKTDPTWASQVDEVWLWNEYPKRWGPDCGIDLIFTHKNGDTWAVQSKCVSPKNDIKKSEIDSFLSESNDSKIDGRLLIASTDGLGKNAYQVINRQEKQVVCFLLEQFRKSEIVFPNSMEDLKKGKRKVKKKPRPHQIEAIDSVFESLTKYDRGQVLMACGTGKTLTSLWIKEKIKATQVLVLVPSLSLLSQTLKEWNAEANKPFKWICVCSDKSVAKDKSEDQWVSNTSEIGVPVTSETLEVKNFLDESGSKVVFATYQSSQLIVEAQEHHDTSEFDLVIADEAHRCAGKVSDAFGSVLDENKIKASKRLFFTATPRILSRQIKTKSLEMDFEIASMDDHSVFGEILYQLKFSEAIAKDLLSDYQVVVIGVDDEIIKQKIINKDLVKVDDKTILDAETIAAQFALTKAIKKYDLKKIITFHGRIKSAKDFSNSFSEVISYINNSDLPLGTIKCDHISGQMKTSERNGKIYQLKNCAVDERKILTNARCLSEGVDVPTLSGIAFINPKQSQIDIIQAVGRAIRKSDDKEKGTIVIPLYISEQESLDDAILLSNFKKVWQIVLALKSQDDSLMECIDQMRMKKGSKEGSTGENQFLDKFIFDIPERITARFPDSIQTLLVQNTSENWLEKFGELKKFFSINGNTTVREDSHPSLWFWCNNQRQNYRANRLSKWKIDLLNQLQFIWNPTEAKWHDSYSELKNLYLIDENIRIKITNYTPLGGWSFKQREYKRANKLAQWKIDLLNEIQFVWDPMQKQWDQSYKELKDFYLKEGHSNPLSRTKLGSWCGSQRQDFKKGKLNQQKINLLNEIQFVWDPTAAQWRNAYEKLKAYYIKEGHSSPTMKENKFLSSWCITQRKLFKKKNLSQQKIDLLNEIQFEWDPLQDLWFQRYKELKDFYLKEGHSSPFKSTHKILNAWSKAQRGNNKKGNLSSERKMLLDDIKFVWDITLLEWENTLYLLKEYKSKNGNLLLKKGTSICTKVRSLRNSYRLGHLSPEKIKILEDLGFIWNEKEYQWDCNYLTLKSHLDRFGNLKDFKKTYPDLKEWFNNLKRKNSFHSMSEEKKSKFKEIKDFL